MQSAHTGILQGPFLTFQFVPMPSPLRSLLPFFRLKWPTFPSFLPFLSSSVRQCNALYPFAYKSGERERDRRDGNAKEGRRKVDEDAIRKSGEGEREREREREREGGEREKYIAAWRSLRAVCMQPFSSSLSLSPYLSLSLIFDIAFIHSLSSPILPPSSTSSLYSPDAAAALALRSFLRQSTDRHRDSFSSSNFFPPTLPSLRLFVSRPLPTRVPERTSRSNKDMYANVVFRPFGSIKVH